MDPEKPLSMIASPQEYEKMFYKRITPHHHKKNPFNILMSLILMLLLAVLISLFFPDKVPFLTGLIKKTVVTSVSTSSIGQERVLQNNFRPFKIVSTVDSTTQYDFLYDITHGQRLITYWTRPNTTGTLLPVTDPQFYPSPDSRYLLIKNQDDFSTDLYDYTFKQLTKNLDQLFSVSAQELTFSRFEGNALYFNLQSSSGAQPDAITLKLNQMEFVKNLVNR